MPSGVELEGEARTEAHTRRAGQNVLRIFRGRQHVDLPPLNRQAKRRGLHMAPPLRETARPSRGQWTNIKWFLVQNPG